MPPYKTVFITQRGQRHQQWALEIAPQSLEVTMLRQPGRAELLPYLAGADYLISERSGTIDAEMMAAAPNLKLILRLGALTHDIDLNAAQAAGIAVCYWPVGGAIRVAEHVLLQLLALSRRLPQLQAIALAASPEWGQSRRTDEDTFAYNWSGRERVEALWQATIGIMGFGEIGAELARRLRGWGCTVLYHKRQRLPERVEVELAAKFTPVDSLLSQSDYLVNLLPYFAETDGLINADFLARMKPGACLASCGSGSVIDEAALAEAVTSGHLAGAALDTYEWEPLPADSPLIAAAKQGYNILLTPHIAAGAGPAARQERRSDFDTIVDHIEGRPLQYRLV